LVPWPTSVHHNAFAHSEQINVSIAENPENVFSAPQCVQRAATNLSRCNLHHHSRGEFHGRSPDYGAAFVAGYVSLIAAHFDNEAPAAIRSCSHLLGDDQKALFIAGHVLIISRSAENTGVGLRRLSGTHGIHGSHRALF
jgi:hypothetical protein